MRLRLLHGDIGTSEAESLVVVFEYGFSDTEESMLAYLGLKTHNPWGKFQVIHLRLW